MPDQPPSHPVASDTIKSPQTVQSVEVAVRILEGIAETQGLVRVNELARRLGMTKARVSRHLQTMLALGLVGKDRQEGYVFGWKFMRLSRAALSDSSLVSTARPHLLALRDQIAHTVILVQPAPDGAVVVDTAENRDVASVTVRIAGHLRFPTSPAARLCVLLRPQATHQQRGQGSLQHWPDFGAEYEVDTGRGVGGVAAPVLDRDNQLVAVVSIVAPSTALRPRPSVALVNALNACVLGIQRDYLN
jgi:DNA-binding IclR family transcriptional regulator